MNTAISFIAEVGDGQLGLGEFLIFWVVLGIAQFIIFWVAFIAILRSKRYTGGGKFLWFVVVLFVPVLGGLGYLLLGRSAQIITASEQIAR